MQNGWCQVLVLVPIVQILSRSEVQAMQAVVLMMMVIVVVQEQVMVLRDDCRDGADGCDFGAGGGGADYRGQLCAFRGHARCR